MTRAVVPLAIFLALAGMATYVLMFFGVAIYGYVIGNISSLLADTDTAKNNYVQKIEELNAFFEDKMIPYELQERIRDYYNHIWQSRLGRDESNILSEMPSSLRTDVTLFLNRDIIQKVPMFKMAGEALIRDLASHLEPAVYMPGDMIIRKGTIADRMFFVSKGHAELLSEDGEVLATFTDGSYFGEMALVLERPRAANIRACDYCDVYFLRKVTFDRLLKMYPDFLEQMNQTMHKRQSDEIGQAINKSMETD